MDGGGRVGSREHGFRAKQSQRDKERGQRESAGSAHGPVTDESGNGDHEQDQAKCGAARGGETDSDACGVQIGTPEHPEDEQCGDQDAGERGISSYSESACHDSLYLRECLEPSKVTKSQKKNH